MVVNAAFLCLAHTLIIAMALVNGDPKYQSIRKENKLDHPVEDTLKVSRVDLSNGGGIEEHQQPQDYLSDYKSIIYDGLSPDRLICNGHNVSSKNLYLLYDAVTGLCNVITNIKVAMAKIYT